MATSMHTTYLKHSPSYAAYHARYGKFLPVGVASTFAAEHGTSLAELGLDPMAERINLLELWTELGY